MKRSYYLGIDLGTSAVKGILRSPTGEYVKARGAYRSDRPHGWFAAVREMIAALAAQTDGEIAAIALSSQVGTYVIDGREVIDWRSPIGREELDAIRAAIPPEQMVRHIGMAHPDLVSYPLPRLLYIKKHFGPRAEVLMPKELLIRELTGETVTDVFSMRGIAHAGRRRYAEELMQALGLSASLPPLRYPTELAGRVTAAAAGIYGLTEGTPVYLGCNDFYAGLLGMGIYEPGDFFDLSGTSEHLGYLAEEINRQGFVSGPYFYGCCTYGGTKSSGAACDLAIRTFGLGEWDMARLPIDRPPIFLPYLCGERAPLFDEQARGVYFGLNDRTDKASLSYATLEGVVFSLYDIATSMAAPQPRRLILGGGSAQDPIMNRLRATLFDCETVSVQENDTSALGACLLAMVGDGAYPDLPTAIRHTVTYRPAVLPQPEWQDILRRRFAIYRQLYGDLKERFRQFCAL